MLPCTILCIDDDTLLLDFLVFQLEEIAPASTLIFKATTGLEGLQYARRHKLDLVILDLGLPDMSGFSVAAALSTMGRSCRVLLVSGNLTEIAASRLLGSQIHGCLLKSSAHGPELKQALQELAAGRTYFPDDVLAVVAHARKEPDHFSKILSDREIELLPYFGYGWPNDRIARYTRISPATVRTHHQNILVKLKLHGREELMRWAMKKGFVDFRYEPEDAPSDALHEDPGDWSV
jgi:DNA-binding NarL/FixJ family response regulator